MLHQILPNTASSETGSSSSVKHDGPIMRERTRPSEEQRDHTGTARQQRAHALRAVRRFAWLEVGSVKKAFSRPTSTPNGRRKCRERQPLGGPLRIRKSA